MRYLHQDHLGSTSSTCPEPVERVTDDTGAAVYEATYDPWGNVSASTGTADTDRLYTGQRFDAATGLYCYNARYYDPTLARFISPDTIVPGVGDPQAWNRYAYVRGNPLRCTDPTGHCFGRFSRYCEKAIDTVRDVTAVVVETAVDVAKDAGRNVAASGLHQTAQAATWLAKAESIRTADEVDGIPAIREVIQVQEKSVLGLFLRLSDAAAITLDRTVITTRDICSPDPGSGVSPYLIIHEGQHAEDQLAQGDKVELNYVREQVSVGYRQNLYEINARAAGENRISDPVLSPTKPGYLNPRRYTSRLFWSSR